jgi:type IX secretion system PorP/SprF family membrane protein
MLQKICHLCLFFLSIKGEAQDLHFSQWFNTPLITNPANTGFIPDADYRIGANYRDQWSSIMANPFKTTSIWGDAQLLRDRIETGWLGVGGVLLHDVVGTGALTSTKIYGSVAYHQMIGAAHLLSFGINAGWSNKRINTQNLKFPDQFDGRFFDNSLPTDVILDRFAINYVDIQAGLNYAFFPSDKIYVNGGISLWHLNRPRESFFTSEAYGYDSRLPMRMNVFANASMKVSESVIIHPMVYYAKMAAGSSLVGGLYAQVNLSQSGEQQLLGGLYTRAGEAAIPMVGFEWNHIRLTFTYDATISSMKQYNQSRGALEFALMRNGYYDTYDGDRRQSLCPSFK